MVATHGKQERVPPPQKGNPQGKEPVKVVSSTALEHVTLVGKCDGTPSTIAKCNGFSVTIKVIKNEGQCDIEIFSVDVNNNEIQNTRQTITPGAILPIYVAPNTTDKVDVQCTRTEKEPECKFSMAV